MMKMDIDDTLLIIPIRRKTIVTIAWKLSRVDIEEIHIQWISTRAERLKETQADARKMEKSHIYGCMKRDTEVIIAVEREMVLKSGLGGTGL
jgi:hypothetical protein